MQSIIWDWGSTLYDRERKIEYKDSFDVLTYCQDKGYRMVLVSLAKITPVPERTEQIEKSPLLKFFEKYAVIPESKYATLDYMVSFLGNDRSDIWIVGDRVRREIKYAKKFGHPSIWYKNGPFVHELPNEDTGQPDHIITDLKEVYDIL